MRFSGRRLNLKLYTGHTLYVHAHAIRSISLNALSHLCILSLRSPHTFQPCFNKERKIRAQRPLILYVQYIHFRFPGLHRRFPRARNDVDTDRLLAHFKTEIISIRIRFGIYSRWNKHFCWKWCKVEGLRTPRRSRIRFSNVAIRMLP